MSTGARVGIAFGILVLAFGIIVAVFMIRRRRIQRANIAYVQHPVPNNQNYYQGQYGGYVPPTGYNPNGPQYPPQSYGGYKGPGGYDPVTGFAPPSGAPPQYYPSPQGPPPGQEGAYSPPQGPPPKF